MRKRARRRVAYRFKETYFKPRGVPLSLLTEITLSFEELESLRLRYLNNLNQEEAAKKMNISQSQYQRDITRALGKLTDALINEKAIKIEEDIANLP